MKKILPIKLDLNNEDEKKLYEHLVNLNLIGRTKYILELKNSKIDIHEQKLSILEERLLTIIDNGLSSKSSQPVPIYQNIPTQTVSQPLHHIEKQTTQKEIHQTLNKNNEEVKLDFSKLETLNIESIDDIDEWEKKLDSLADGGF